MRPASRGTPILVAACFVALASGQGSVTCPGMTEYCNCQGDCTDNPSFCACQAAQACCSSGTLPWPSPVSIEICTGDGESCCENLGYDRGQCAGVGCCEYQGGQCWSSVGAQPCSGGSAGGGGQQSGSRGQYDAVSNLVGWSNGGAVVWHCGEL